MVFARGRKEYNGTMLNLGPSHDGFHSLCVKPEIKFENQKDTELVLLSLRAHPITLVPTFFNSIILIILAFFSSFILGQFLNGAQLFYIGLFFAYIIFFYFWFLLVNWYFNIGIVTNEQIIDVDFSPLTFRHVSRTELSHVEDISVKSSGFISSIVDYGNVFVQTAGSEINTEFMDVPHPAKAAHIIQDILKDYGNS
jgi:hypothetical protein